MSFLELNDGSCLKNLQVVVDAATPAAQALDAITTGAAVEVEGALVASPGKNQQWEVHAAALRILGSADADAYPLQKKRHSDEFLRSIAHLRPRTNKYGALFRIRSETAFAVHQFFRQRGFHLLHAPIITGSDCEGAGEMFRVTTLPLAPPVGEAERPDAAEDFFGKEANLTVSGQLEAELFACALGNVYTFGPTFRAENSNTPRHAAEFWMIEPEMAFADLHDNMDLGEDLVRSLVQHALATCADDLELFARFVDPRPDGKPARHRRGYLRADAIWRGHRRPAAVGQGVSVSRGLRGGPADGARALPDGGTLPQARHGPRLPQGDQVVLHAAERRREDGSGHGSTGAAHR